MFKRENISNDLLDKLVMYMVPATVIGARLGHVLFYGPYWGEDGYFSHPWEIVKIWEGGLASHGAAIVILFALWYFSKKTVKKPYLWILDRIAAPIAIAGAFIRLGNLVNHEMVGYITDVPWGFRFLHHDCLNFSNGQYLCDWSEIPVRHPAQLYEAICYFISFGVLLFLYWRKDKWKQEGYIFGVFLLLIFGFRFLIEFLKEGQTARDAELMLNTGQMLSIPFVVIGILLIYRATKRKFTSS
jgi:prolipoprotein diacylglyceryl transferase